MSNTTARLQHCLDRLRAGDPEARRNLVDVAARRLEHLTRRMFREDFRRLQAQEQTTAVFHGAVLRLYRALEQVRPASPRHFFRLAALQVRRELLDLARRVFGPHGPAAHKPLSAEAAEVAGDAERLAAWTEFHEKVGQLPDDARELFGLLWYNGLSTQEAADLLGVTDRCVRYRWREVKVLLFRALDGTPPPW